MFRRKSEPPKAQRKTDVEVVQPRLRRRVGRRGLQLIALLLVVSGALRLVDGAGEALARDPGQEAEMEMATPEHQGESLLSDTKDMGALLTALLAREAAVEKREAKIAAREKGLELAERQIAANLAALVEAEEALAETIALADGAAEADLQQLTSVYEKMKPKQAAVLFNEMDAVFAAGFLGRMKPDAASAILAGMDPQSAYSISLLLAGRNMEVPTE